jgi:hypothetical protein
MKVTLDLAKLRREGTITQAEFDKLSALHTRDAGSLAINILVGFGVVAVSGGALALAPTPLTAMAIGALVLAVGLALLWLEQRWFIVAQICILTGALLLGGGIVTYGGGSVLSFLTVTAILAAGGILARSGLLIVAAVLALSSCLGVRTGYVHATYMLGIQEPAAVIVLFSALALITFLVSKILHDPYQRLALAAARTSVFLVNFGFWIGSLWGDRLVLGFAAPVVISRDVFALGWGLALIGVFIWSAQAARRWVLNVVVVFAAIHFYTQWFERLSVTPQSVIIAGLLILVFAFGLWQLNRRWVAAT